MRLDRLEISGFKSFPDRSDLAFDRGVTAIVGPNGCGKSNLVDAITWVLGEQSAKSLRGERMEDVIFSGSDARRPTGAAEVRLRLSGVHSGAVRRSVERRLQGRTEPVPPEAEDPGPEQMGLPEAELRAVEVARRLYRSGESEYLIDGETCRLRDIQDLLMDAGLGVKGYAVIEQGKIGQILTAKPADRRTLIEEAAGVTKYKSRRRAAELKLEAAQQNLTRVDDIIFEVERQRTALRRQASKARRYRRLREELRRWEKVLFARRFRALGQALELARIRLAEARAREAAAAARVSALEMALDALRADVSAAEQRAVSTRDLAHARELDQGRREQQLASDRQQVTLLGAVLADLGTEVDGLESRREPSLAELAARRQATGRAEAERDAAADRLREAEREHAQRVGCIAELEAAVETARGRTYAAQAGLSTLRHVTERAAEARERITAEISRLEAEATDLERERDRAQAARQAAATALRTMQEAMAVARASQLARGSALTASRGEREERVQELRAREREAAAVAARLRSLEELDAARAGYDEAARHLLAEGGTSVAHCGSVADHLEADSRAERAVEACLGDLLQAIVVRSRDDAARALDVVRERSLGRCHVVVLDADEGASPGAAAAPPGVVPLASVARTVGPHADRLARLLADAWMAESRDLAWATAVATGLTVATTAGEVFRGGALASAGGRAGARGILTTKREIKELRERLGLEHAQLERRGADLLSLEAVIANAEQSLAGLAGELHEHEKAALGHELQVARTGEELDRLSAKLEQVGHERRRADEELAALASRERDAQASIARLEGEQQGFERELAEAQRRLLEAREAAASQAETLAEAKVGLAALGERALALAQDVERLDAAARELGERIEAKHADIGRTRSRVTDLEAAIVTTEGLLADDGRALEALRADVRAADAQVATLQASYDGREAEVRAARGAVEDVRAAVGQLDVARATAESELAHLEASCVETLQAVLADVAAEVEALEREGRVVPDASVLDEEEGDAEAEEAVPARGEGPLAGPAEALAAARAAGPLTAEEAIAELRAKIDRLGPVNMMAIEQFDELEDRHVFLSTQRKDLVDSITATGEAIKRIERTTRERFREAFAAINQYFAETFATLFGGGRAGLVLLDEDDLLESGVDINAQPPGKRLQNVQLLSGGEKALTAMALMFAIFRYRPSPFCLLDEIDAPLDDANIGRFIDMLRGMLDRTQFILITHSRKTMEIADRLYGVTMEEPGVSKLISIQLN